VNGAPANPISGTRPASDRRARRTASNTNGTPSAGATSRSRATSSRVRTGRGITGPSPFTKASPTPIGSVTRRISAKMIAASTPSFSTASTVISAAASGVLHRSRRLIRARSARYSGRYRPAWRISQTGVYSVGCRRQARRKGWVVDVTSLCPAEELSRGAGPGSLVHAQHIVYLQNLGARTRPWCVSVRVKSQGAQRSRAD